MIAFNTIIVQSITGEIRWAGGVKHLNLFVIIHLRKKACAIPVVPKHIIQPVQQVVPLTNIEESDNSQENNSAYVHMTDLKNSSTLTLDFDGYRLENYKP